MEDREMSILLVHFFFNLFETSSIFCKFLGKFKIEIPNEKN